MAADADADVDRRVFSEGGSRLRVCKGAGVGIVRVVMRVRDDEEEDEEEVPRAMERVRMLSGGACMEAIVEGERRGVRGSKRLVRWITGEKG